MIREFWNKKSKFFITGIGILTLSLTSCEGLFNEVLTAETDYFEMDFTIEASGRDKFQIFSEELFSNEIEKALNEAGISTDLLQSVYLKEAEVSITSQGTYTNFNFLKFAELTVYTDSLRDEKIAFLDPVPRDLSIINLELSSENLLPYFQSPEFLLTAQGYLLEIIYENIDMHARVKFELKGGVK